MSCVPMRFHLSSLSSHALLFGFLAACFSNVILTLLKFQKCPSPLIHADSGQVLSVLPESPHSRERNGKTQEVHGTSSTDSKF